MCNGFMLFRVTFLSLLVICVYTASAQIEPKPISKPELEIRALETIAGSKRQAQRMHRTIQRYRVQLERDKEKLARGVDPKQINGGFHRHLAMSNLYASLAPANRRLVHQITSGTLNLNDYLNSRDSITTYEDRHMEEIKVIGNMFQHMPLDPIEFSVGDIRAMRFERGRANQLYRKGYYEEAYPLLLALAKRGFKDSQSRLAYILLNGTESVQKSNLRALGWLGAAAYGESEPIFKVLFKRYMQQVPESVKPNVEAIVSDYQNSFAHDEHQSCSTFHKYARGIVKRTYCQFKLEGIAEACEAGFGGGLCWAHSVNTGNNLRLH